MQKGKSALSAALRGNAPAAEEAPRQPKSDTFSFPCLGGAENDTVSELASNFQAGVNMRGSLAGSAPTATLLSDGSVAVRGVLTWRVARDSALLQQAAGGIVCTGVHIATAP
jgi:hypothetical protein